MNIEKRQLDWWHGLTPEQQEQALAVTGEIPQWMAESLQRAGLLVVEAELDGPSHTAKLMPTALRDFLEQRAHGD